MPRESASGPPPLAITGVGLATAQGSSRDLRAGGDLSPPAAVRWPLDLHAACPVYRPARGLDGELEGTARLAALARRALEDCLGEGAPLPPELPVLLASCNGGAAASELETWRSGFDLGRALLGRSLPVASAACASGLQALFLGTRLVDAGAREVIVLAVDIASAPAHASFETLRILAEAPDRVHPFHPERAGFVLGEAAVAIRIGRADAADPEAPGLSGPALGHDLADDDGLTRVLGALELEAPTLVLGQGTGPAPIDRAELAAIATRITSRAPLSTALHHFGHTLGASGLLSVGLAALAHRAPLANALAVALAGRLASDGRALVTGPVAGGETVVVCRALGGACGACVVGPERPGRRAVGSWRRPAPLPPLRDPNLRHLAASAVAHRPARPPDLLLVRLEAPLVPPPDARLTGRLLPSSILEMTPGFVAQLLAQAWGFPGPAVCLVADTEAETAVTEIAAACRTAGDDVFRVDLHGQGEDRHVVWNP